MGITGIAMAVIAGGDFVGTLNLAVPTARFTEDKHPLFKRELRTACVAVAEILAPNLPITSKKRSPRKLPKSLRPEMTATFGPAHPTNTPARGLTAGLLLDSSHSRTVLYLELNIAVHPDRHPSNPD